MRNKNIVINRDCYKLRKVFSYPIGWLFKLRTESFWWNISSKLIEKSHLTDAFSGQAKVSITPTDTVIFIEYKTIAGRQQK
jgi:hypothetical protein